MSFITARLRDSDYSDIAPNINVCNLTCSPFLLHPAKTNFAYASEYIHKVLTLVRTLLLRHLAFLCTYYQ